MSENISNLTDNPEKTTLDLKTPRSSVKLQSEYLLDSSSKKKTRLFTKQSCPPAL